MDDKQLRKARWATRFFFLNSGIGVSCWAPMVPFAKSRLELNEAELGLVLLAFGLGALAAMPVTGWLVGRSGSRKASGIAAAIMIATIPLLTIAPTALMLSMLLFVFGATLGTLNVAINSHAVTVETKCNRNLMSGFHCLFSTGGLVGAGLISVLLDAGFSLFGSALFLSSLLACLLTTQCRNLLSPEHEVQPRQESSFKLPQGRVLFIGILCFIMFMSEGAMLDWGALLLRSVYDYSTANAGMGYALFSVAMATGRFFGDRIIQRMGQMTVIQAGSVLASAGLILLVNSPWQHLELLGFVMMGLGASNIVPIMFSTAGRLPNSSPSAALAVVTTLGYTGILLGPAMIGFVAQTTTLSFSLLGVAVLVFAVSLCGRLAVKPVPETVPIEIQ